MIKNIKYHNAVQKVLIEATNVQINCKKCKDIAFIIFGRFVIPDTKNLECFSFRPKFLVLTALGN